MKSRFFIILLLLAAVLQILQSQSSSKKPLNHDVYDGWKRVSGESISNNGKWVVFTTEPQEGDAQLSIYNVDFKSTELIPRGVNGKITQNSDFVVFSIKPFYADVKKLKIAKKKEDDLPKDSLGIFSLGTRSLTKIPRVKSFKLPEKGSGWVAYQLEKELPDTTKKGKRSIEKKADDMDPADEDTPKKDEKGTTIVLRNLLTNREYTFPFGSEYELRFESCCA